MEGLALSVGASQESRELNPRVISRLEVTSDPQRRHQVSHHRVPRRKSVAVPNEVAAMVGLQCPVTAKSWSDVEAESAMAALLAAISCVFKCVPA